MGSPSPHSTTVRADARARNRREIDGDHVHGDAPGRAARARRRPAPACRWARGADSRRRSRRRRRRCASRAARRTWRRSPPGRRGRSSCTAMSFERKRHRRLEAQALGAAIGEGRGAVERDALAHRVGVRARMREDGRGVGEAPRQRQMPCVAASKRFIASCDALGAVGGGEVGHERDRLRRARRPQALERLLRARRARSPGGSCPVLILR